MSAEAQWIEDINLNGFRYDFLYINVIDTGNIWVVGSQSINERDTSLILRRTTSLGWDFGELNDLPGSSLYLSVAGLDSTTAFVGNENGQVFKTTNGGFNWSLILDAGLTLICDIKFSRQNRNVGYIFCSSSKIYKTTNYGTTWQLFSPYFGSGYYGWWKTGYVTDSAHAWFGLNTSNSGQYAKIIFTTNGGINWTISTMIQGLPDIDAVSFKTDNQFGIASFSHFGVPDISLEYTSSGGENWLSLNNFYLHDKSINGLINITGSSVWYFTADDMDSLHTYVYKSTNDGTSWSEMYIVEPATLLSSTNIDAVRLNNKIYAWTCSRGTKSILKLVDTAVVIGIKPNSQSVPSKFTLRQNYPNPFNPITKIKYDIPKTSRVSIKIYDLIGREVATLVNELKQPGYYEAIFNGNNLASGVYFYRIEADNYNAVKKMVLMK